VSGGDWNTTREAAKLRLASGSSATLTDEISASGRSEPSGICASVRELLDTLSPEASGWDSTAGIWHQLHGSGEGIREAASSLQNPRRYWNQCQQRNGGTLAARGDAGAGWLAENSQCRICAHTITPRNPCEAPAEHVQPQAAHGCRHHQTPQACEPRKRSS
jgi:hypothetical protein